MSDAKYGLLCRRRRNLSLAASVTAWLLLASGCTDDVVKSEHAVDDKSSDPSAVLLRTSTDELLRQAETYRPTTLGRIDDLSLDAVTILSQLPGVVRVTYSGPESNPTHRIVHLLDWHFVSLDDYAADLRSTADGSVSDEQVAERHAALVQEVDDMQQQQMAVLRCLIRHHGLTRIHAEGLTKKEPSILAAIIPAVRNTERQLAQLRSEFADVLANADTDEDARRVAEGLRDLEHDHHASLLRLGAAGRLLLRGKIGDVLPLENEAAYAAANPVTDDGKLVIDDEAMNTRREAQVMLLLDASPFAMIVLGGAHDLSAHVERQSGGRAEYIRVEVQAFLLHGASGAP